MVAAIDGFQRFEKRVGNHLAAGVRADQRDDVVVRDAARRQRRADQADVVFRAIELVERRAGVERADQDGMHLWLGIAIAFRRFGCDRRIVEERLDHARGMFLQIGAIGFRGLERVGRVGSQARCRAKAGAGGTRPSRLWLQAPQSLLEAAPRDTSASLPKRRMQLSTMRIATIATQPKTLIPRSY